MRKSIFTCLLVFSIFVASCADSSPKNNAKSAYVLASQKVSKAEKAFNLANYADAQKLCLEARNDVEKIIENYPDSDVAFKLVSDSSIYIGSCRYLDLKEKIIPQLELLNDSQMQPIALAWAVAVKNNAYTDLAKAIVKNIKQFDAKTIDSIFNCVLLNIKNPSQAEVLRNEYRLARLGVSDKKSEPVAVVKTEKKSAKIADVAKFLRDVSTSASLISYDVRNAEKLRSMAKIASCAEKQIVDKVVSELSKAYDNVLKISSQTMREKALSEIAIAFAYTGDNLRAIAISQKITNGDLFYGVFKEIAESACKGDNYRAALTLASRLSDVQEKSKFLSSLAIGVAENGLYNEAREIASTVQDILLRNEAYAKSAKLAFDAGKPNDALQCISKIDVKNLNCLDVFCKTDGLSVHNASALRLACVANKLIGVNEKFASALNSMSIVEVSRETAKLDEKVIGTIFDNLVKMGKEDDAFNFIVSRFSQLQNNNVAEKLCALAESTKDKNLSLKIYKKLGELASVNEVSVMELALHLSRSGMSRKDAVNILGDSLPKFK
ncbi:MAG: hypothetical protein E7036_09880 [Opitutales bacterium]|nr:hypothetical protein [Opitutales bacterium]